MLALAGVTWRLAEFVNADGVSASPVAEATLTFEEGRAGGNTGCNSFSAGYTVSGQQLSFQPGVSTMMACAEPIMAQEQALLSQLNEVAAYEIVSGQLHLLDAAGQTLLTFEQLVPASLTGILWRATNYNNGRQAVVNVLDGTEITATFGDDGSLTGTAGCNNYRAGYTVENGQLTIGPAISTRMMCAEPAGVMEQESAYLAALETAATYRIQGDQLELRTADGALVARYVVASATEGAGDDVNIVGANWQWVETAYGDGTTLTVDDPTRYMLSLQPDGTVALRADCNRGRGSYTLDGALLSLDVAVMTRMACPEGSLAEEFVRDLNAAATYVMDGDDLVINLFADAGNMRFERVAS